MYNEYYKSCSLLYNNYIVHHSFATCELCCYGNHSYKFNCLNLIIKMSIVVDIVSEESFYENLCLGLTKVLENTQGVQDIELEKRLPCERMILSSWEQRHACLLPDDLRQFYLSTDGFKLIWNYEFAGEVLPIGNLRINSITELRRLAGIKAAGDADCPTLLDIEMCNPNSFDTSKPKFGVKCKLFELDPCQNVAKVCLVYMEQPEGENVNLNKKEQPSIWLLDRSYEWHFLANTFTQYFRMMIVHQGLPQWQFRFTPMGLSPWAEQMMMMICPHLLEEPRTDFTAANWHNEIQNQLDPSIFKTHSKSSRNRKYDEKKNI